MNWRDDITAANEAVCESLATAAAELDKRIAKGTRCTCGGHGICITCILDELNREHAVTRAA